MESEAIRISSKRALSVSKMGLLLSSSHSSTKGAALLHTIPTELTLLVKAYLPPSSLLSLSYTCKKFYLSSTVVVEDIFPKQHTAGHGGVEERGERLAFLCMLERDQRLSKSKLVCSSCIKVRDTSSFSISAVRDVPSERQCLCHEGKMWICPRNVWDCSQVQAFRDDPNRCQTYGPCECKNHSVWLRGGNLTTLRPLLALDAGSPMSAISITTVLRPLDLNACPHIKLNDPVVLRWFLEDYGMSQADRTCKRKCLVCKATFEFELGTPLNGKRVLNFVIQRNLDIYDVADPDWISQLSYPHEFADLERAWDACPVDPSIQETRPNLQTARRRIARGTACACEGTYLQT